MSDSVHENLPAVPAAAVEEKIFDGEVVEEDAAAVYPGAAAARSVVAVVRHERARMVWRHAWFVVAGVAEARHRIAHAYGPAMYREQIRAAHASGDHERLVLWEARLAAWRSDRHDRRQERTEKLLAVVQASPMILKVTVIGLLILGVLLGHPAEPFQVIIAIVRDVAAVVRALWRPVLWAVMLGTPVLLWHLGRTRGRPPRWAATSADADVDLAIDERAVTQALGALRIPQITDYLKTGAAMPYISPCRIDGRGTYAEIRLPLGLPAAEIAKQARREKLAAALYRHTKEVWPTVGADNSILKLWIADKGALADGAGPYPLLGDGVADVFKGVPFGRTLRGDPVVAPLMERNTITGGMPGQGKSSAARVIMIGAGLDWRAELWIMIPDINFDFERMKRRCSRYVMGAEDEKVETIRDWLSDLKDEVQRRGELLVRYEVPAVTPKLAGAGVGLHPLFVLLEEAHVAIQHHIYGKEIAGLLVDIVKLGRKRGIHLVVSTQAPTKDSMPRDVTRNCSNGIAFAVGDHVPNDALLGAGAYRAGHRATELIPGTDRGVAVVKGFSGERSEMVQVYFLSIDEPDEVTPLIDRAMAEIARRGKGLPGGPAPLPAIEARDLLGDLGEVLGDSDEKVSLADLAWRLKRLAPSWGAYKSLNSTDLRAWLGRENVRTTNPKNVPTLDPADLRRALEERGELAVPAPHMAARSPPARGR